MNTDVWEVLVDEGWIKALAAGTVKIEEVKHRAEFLERALIDVSKPQPDWSSFDPGGDSHTGVVAVPRSTASTRAIQARTTVNINNLFQNAFGQPPMGVLQGISPMASLFADIEEEEPADPPELPVTESETPVVGFRTWKVYPSMGDITAHQLLDRPIPYPGLSSPVTDHRWDGPIMRADGPPAPYDPHDYRWKDRDDHCYGIYAHTGPDWCDFHRGNPAMGKVEGWGRVVVHDRGWRAENVRIVSLLMHPLVDRATATALADRYQCDVTFDPTSWKEA